MSTEKEATLNRYCIHKMFCQRFFLCAAAIASLTLAGCVTTRDQTARTCALANTRATYCSVPRLPNGRADVDKLVAELVEIRANTYSFCIHTATTDWDDLKLFLPKARAKGIRVWASVVPPTESPPHSKLFAEPFRLDYERWAIEFAKLSKREPNLVAWSIDDFTHNLKFYTPEKLKAMLDGARKINPKLAFVPCCYYTAITPRFATNYARLLDGILFPYRDESGRANLTNATHVATEVARVKEVLATASGFHSLPTRNERGESRREGQSEKSSSSPQPSPPLRGREGEDRAIPIIVDVYASAHSRLGATTPQYVEQVMTDAHRSADGVMVYRHQDPKANAEKFQIVKRLFRSWAK